MRILQTKVDSQHAPLPSAGISVAAVAMGRDWYDHYTCAVTSGGCLLCWGRNNYGQLGIGSAADQLSPVAVSLGAGG
jgi:alpha-tubulin suppressor-like RCC1 family protein